MIVSVHIPKTAGTSFQADLLHVFGARLLSDYDDWPENRTPEAAAHDARNRAGVLADAESLGERYDAIHGHFAARKYAGIFASTALVTIVRDPYQHAVSAYEHAMRHLSVPHPTMDIIREARMSILDFIEAFPNHQALYVGEMPVEDFAMIGVTERYQRSVALFETMFGIPMPRAKSPQNVNQTKHGAEYDITPEVRRAVDRYRSDDIALYRRARERFATLCSAYGV
jgi:Sulfotransferase family